MKILRTVIFIISLISSVTSSFSQEVGNATFYSNKLHGKLTASGIRYDKDSLTCAHRTLPFGTQIKVTNTKNQKTVIVKVTDRGPHVKRFIIDLSYAAAKELDMIKMGICPVELQVLKPESIKPASDSN